MTANEVYLRRVEPSEAGRVRRGALDPGALRDAAEIVAAVRDRGEQAVREYAARFGERAADEPLLLGRAEMMKALDGVGSDVRALLERVAGRIESFARAQRGAILDLDVTVPGGRAGHTAVPVQSAGCYAPAGRYPLPSSVLMTAVTARVAGCERVVVASPSTDPIMLAAAAIAGADEYLAVGGAHAIAAMAHGYKGFCPCDVIVGPGNKWVTAAKSLVSDVVGIDMLAGPSELLIIADETADERVVAADLLAQAEHDDDAVPMLLTTSAGIVGRVERALAEQLGELSTSATARKALKNGFACVVRDLDEACEVSDKVAAEHVEIHVRDAQSIAARLKNAGGVFVGPMSAEVFGDYGLGPNHTLPTGGSARYRAGLSVMHFLRLRTWLRVDEGPESHQMISDTADLAEYEGLLAHKRSAQIRIKMEISREL